MFRISPKALLFKRKPLTLRYSLKSNYHTGISISAPQIQQMKADLSEFKVDARLVDLVPINYAKHPEYVLMKSWVNQNWNAANATPSEAAWMKNFKAISKATFVHQFHLLEKYKLFSQLYPSLFADSCTSHLLSKMHLGKCVGFSSIHMVSSFHQHSDHRASLPNDRWPWFENTYKMLSNWDGVTPLDPQAIIHFQGSLKLLLSLHTPGLMISAAMSQGDIHLLPFPQNKPKINLVENKSLTTDEAGLETELAYLVKNHSQRRLAVFVGAGKHATDFTFINERLSFYDSNNITGPIPVRNVKRIANLVFCDSALPEGATQNITIKSFTYGITGRRIFSGCTLFSASPTHSQPHSPNSTQPPLTNVKPAA